MESQDLIGVVAIVAVAVGLMALAPVTGAVLRGERWAMALTLALLIFLTDASFRARNWADKSLDFQTLLRGALWAGCGAIGIARLSCTGRLLTTAPALFTAAFIFVLLASALWSPTPLYTAQSALAYSWLFLFGLAAAQVLDEDHVLLAVALGCGLIVLPSLAIAPFAQGLTPPSPGSTGEVGRLRGLTDHPIPMAETSALFSFACFALMGKARGMGKRAGLCLLAVAGLVAAALTQSRIPPLAMAASAAAYWAYRRGGWLLLLPTICLFGGLVLALDSLGGLASMLPQDLMELVSRSGHSGEILSLSGRLRIWPYALDKIAESPLLGHGHASGMYLFKGFSGWHITHAHNAYLQALLYVGIVGGGLLAGVLFCQLRLFLTRPQPVRDILLLYMMLKGMTEQSFLSNMPSGGVALWMVTVGMAALAWRKR